MFILIYGSDLYAGIENCNALFNTSTCTANWMTYNAILFTTNLFITEWWDYAYTHNTTGTDWQSSVFPSTSRPIIFCDQCPGVGPTMAGGVLGSWQSGQDAWT